MTRSGAPLAAIFALLIAGCAAVPGSGQRVPPDLASLAAYDAPIMRAEIAGTGTQATLTPWGQNGDTVTWGSETGISLAFQDGVLVSTRGLTGDLMSADIGATRAALRGGVRTDYTTFASYLDDNGETVFRSFVCSLDAGLTERLALAAVTVQAVRFDEVCASLTGQHTNSYWVGGDGTMWRSQQWIGDAAGYLVTDRLVK